MKDFKCIPIQIKIVGGQEDLSVLMFRDSSEWVYRYKYQLKTKMYRFI